MVVNRLEAPDLVGELPHDPSQPWMQVARALTEAYGDVSSYPHGADYYPFVARHFTHGMRAMSKELEWQRAFVATREYPTYDAYLDNGKSSIMSPALMATLLAVTRTPEEASYAERGDIAARCDEVALTVGACVRLANDIRSHARELLFEQKTNSVSILMMSRGMTESEASTYVADETEAHIKALASLVPALPPELRACGKLMVRHVRFVKEAYLAREFHHVWKDISLEPTGSNEH
jgi:hypothetical protein